MFVVSNSNKYFVLYKSEEGYLCNLRNFETQEEADKCARDFSTVSETSVVYTDFNTLFFKVLGPLAP